MIFLTAADLFAPGHTLAAALFASGMAPWEAVDRIQEFILGAGPSLGADYRTPYDGVWIHTTSDVASTVSISGPCIIGPGTQLRHGAFIRGRALIGEGCVVGNSTEIKNAILMDGAQAPHFNYVGDSILGFRTHIGAGVITSNIKCDRRPVVLRLPGGDICTGMRKLGALIGDYAEAGCGAVLCPGTIIGPGAVIYPLSCVRGYVPGNSIYKSADCIVEKRRTGE